jgi:hypothetical protein
MNRAERRRNERLIRKAEKALGQRTGEAPMTSSPRPVSEAFLRAQELAARASATLQQMGARLSVAEAAHEKIKALLESPASEEELTTGRDLLKDVEDVLQPARLKFAEAAVNYLVALDMHDEEAMKAVTSRIEVASDADVVEFGRPRLAATPDVIV